MSREEYWFCMSNEILNTLSSFPEIDDPELRMMKLDTLRNAVILFSSEDNFNQAITILSMQPMQEQNPMLRLIRK